MPIIWWGDDVNKDGIDDAYDEGDNDSYGDAYVISYDAYVLSYVDACDEDDGGAYSDCEKSLYTFVRECTIVCGAPPITFILKVIMLTQST